MGSAEVTSVIVAGARTPIGKLLGSLTGFSGSDLGACAIQGAMEKARIPVELIDQVIMGQVLTAGEGQLPARQAAIKAGIGWDVPTMSINKMCLSGMSAIALADQSIRSGEHTTVIAGGQESMTNAPHLLPKSRQGYKYGDVVMLDHLAHDGLHDVFTCQPMGALTEQANSIDPFSREQQDSFAIQSHHRAAAAWEKGLFNDEVISVSIPGRKGESHVFSRDEGIRPDSTLDAFGRLSAVFDKNGCITAANASPISDGAAAVVVMRKDKAQVLGLPWLAEIVSYGSVAGPDSTLQNQPSRAIIAALERRGLVVDDIDLFEINEAFAAVGLASMKELGCNDTRVNVNGGAIALGHPLGMSGARIVLHLAHELSRRGGGMGAAGLCGAGGQGDALVIRVPGSQGGSSVV